MSNLLIASLSELRKDEKRSYEVIGSPQPPVFGYFSNEPSLRYICKHIHKQGEKEHLDKIIALVTPEDKNNPCITGGVQYESTISYYKKVILECGERSDILETIDLKNNEEDRPFDVILGELISKINDDKIYIDLSGGSRVFSLYLLLLPTFLEIGNSSIEMIIFSELARDSAGGEIPKIRIEKDSRQILKMIRGAEIFTTTGNAEALAAELKLSETPKTRKAAEAICRYSDRILLNRADGIAEIVKELSDDLKEEWDSKNLTDAMFLKLLPAIKTKMHLDSDEPLFLSAIRWNLENKMILQALTLYNELIPQYYYDSGFFTVSEEKKKEIDRQSKSNNKGKNNATLYFQATVLNAYGEVLKNKLTDLIRREEPDPNNPGKYRYYIDIGIGENEFIKCLNEKNELSKYLKNDILNKAVILQTILAKAMEGEETPEEKEYGGSFIAAVQRLRDGSNYLSGRGGSIRRGRFFRKREYIDQAIKTFSNACSDLRSYDERIRTYQDIGPLCKPDFTYSRDESFLKVVNNYLVVRAARNKIVHILPEEADPVNDDWLNNQFHDYYKFDPHEYRDFLMKCLEDHKVLWEKKQIG